MELCLIAHQEAHFEIREFLLFLKRDFIEDLLLSNRHFMTFIILLDDFGRVTSALQVKVLSFTDARASF